MAERADMVTAVRRILEQELKPKRHKDIVLLGIQDIPLEEAARRMKTNRNALYKLLHDAHLRHQAPPACRRPLFAGDLGHLRAKTAFLR